MNNPVEPISFLPDDNRAPSDGRIVHTVGQISFCDRPRDEKTRFAHFKKRCAERDGPKLTLAAFRLCEAKIRQTFPMMEKQEPVPDTLPKKLWAKHGKKIKAWRVWIACEPHTVIWGKKSKGIISYLGRGEINARPNKPKTP